MKNLDIPENGSGSEELNSDFTESRYQNIKLLPMKELLGNLELERKNSLGSSESDSFESPE